MDLEIKKSLYDILQAGKDISKFTLGMEFHEFQTNGMVQAAVERKFEIIGEALSRIGHSNPDVLAEITHYERIIGFRNIIAHGYDVVDVEIVWEAIKDYLPTLLGEVKKLL